MWLIWIRVIFKTSSSGCISQIKERQCNLLSTLHWKVISWDAITETNGQRILTKGRIAGGRIFHGGQCMKPTSRKHCSRLSCCYWGLIDRFCCIHRSRDFQCFSVGLITSRNCPCPWGISTPWFLGPTRDIPKRQLDRFSRFFLQGASVRLTHRQTDRPTSVRIGRICAMHAIRPKMTESWVFTKWS